MPERSEEERRAALVKSQEATGRPKDVADLARLAKGRTLDGR